MPTFEEIASAITGVRRAEQAGHRNMMWLSSDRILGVTRDERGAIEIHIVGPALEATDSEVRRALRTDSLQRQSGDAGEVSWLTLDRGRHLDPVAALICSQLLNAGVEVPGQRERAFAEVEPIIRLALEKVAAASEVLTGLAGELYVLHALTEACPDHAAWIADSWAGYDRSTRDIQLGPVGIEVKTTTRMMSTHHIQGTHQVDVGTAVHGGPESDLYLLSVGLLWHADDSDRGESIASLVENLTARLDEKRSETFLAKVRQYGGASAVEGGVSISDDDTAWHRRFTSTFQRMYDMSDPGIGVLHGADVAEHSHVVADSVSYRIALPAVVEGANPVDGIDEIVSRLIA